MGGKETNRGSEQRVNRGREAETESEKKKNAYNPYVFHAIFHSNKSLFVKRVDKERERERERKRKRIRERKDRFCG